MPRVDSDAAAGLHFLGAYQALLDLERRRNERDDQLAEAMMAEHGFFCRRGRLLTERLEAGEPVVVRCAQLELALWDRDREGDPSAARARLPFDREVRFVRVSPDDRIMPSADRTRDRAVKREW